MLKMQFGGPFAGEEVDAFVDLWRIMPVLFTMLVYWSCYSQVTIYNTGLSYFYRTIGLLINITFSENLAQPRRVFTIY